MSPEVLAAFIATCILLGLTPGLLGLWFVLR